MRNKAVIAGKGMGVKGETVCCKYEGSVIYFYTNGLFQQIVLIQFLHFKKLRWILL